jgi:hypothetical protein
MQAMILSELVGIETHPLKLTLVDESYQ